MPQKQDCVLLLPAAGQGLRMGGDIKKPYLLLAGKPVVVHTLEACLNADIFTRLIVIVSPGEEALFQREICNPFFNEDQSVIIIPGGKSRQESVYKGLKTLHGVVDDNTIICVHDAVRPLVSPFLMQQMVEEAKRFGAVAAAVPVTDTIKIVDKENNVVTTPLRDTLVAVQTPQCFKFSLLWDAHCQASAQASDDAALVEKTGAVVRIIPGNYENIKLTTPHDLKVAELCLTDRFKEGL